MVPPRKPRFNGLLQLRHLPRLIAAQAEVVEEAIDFGQNNVRRNNTYTGDWHFMIEELGNAVTWDAWRSGPNQ